MRQILTFLCLFWIPVVSLGNGQWYDIEVLAFAYQSPTVTQEQWPALTGFPDLAAAAMIMPDTTPEHLGQAFRPLPKDEQNFNDSYKNINYASKTRVLFHKSWSQFVTDGYNLPIRLYGGKNIQEASLAPLAIYSLEKPAFNLPYAQMHPTYLMPPYPWELEGTIQMRLSRYMHVDTDFVFQREPDHQPIRSHSTLKLRSKEVHYVDHPYFGLLIRINKKAD